ncbi:MAG: undecaprenyl-diphosphate phosphatase [Ruminococcaceae bacterium]|nr:undecaprenyl-diphosphate phosphatase [Oscillospiraceae bacterium]
MELFIEILKSLLYGIVEGITEWLPISSTGHLILLGEFVSFDHVSDEFVSVFEVVVQLGAILAVAVVFFPKIWPFAKKGEILGIMKKNTFLLWVKIIVACLPAAIVGLLFDDAIDALFYNALTVGIMLILVGVVFLIVEQRSKTKTAAVTELDALTFRHALGIGLFQLIAAIFPGTSRSGATILGGLMLGVNRTTAAEFTFFLGIPVMFGASLLKLVKYGFAFTAAEGIVLAVGMVSAFAVSMVCIRFLMDYIKRHDFKIFGWYRIALGIVVLGYFAVKSML